MSFGEMLAAMAAGGVQVAAGAQAQNLREERMMQLKAAQESALQQAQAAAKQAEMDRKEAFEMKKLETKHGYDKELEGQKQSFQAGQKALDRATSTANSIRAHSGDSNGVDSKTGKKLRGQPRYDKDTGQFLVTFSDGSMEWRQPEDIAGFKKPETDAEKLQRETEEQARIDAAGTEAEKAVSKRKGFFQSDEDYAKQYGMTPAQDQERIKKHLLKGGNINDQKSPSRKQQAHESSAKVQGGPALAEKELAANGGQGYSENQLAMIAKVKAANPGASDAAIANALRNNPNTAAMFK